MAASTSNPAQSLDPAFLATLKDYALLARIAVEGFMGGMHRSVRHGYGVEFQQYRGYSPGEDLKFIDWKVYARTSELHARVFQEETNLSVWLAVDSSGSMDYQGRLAPVSKIQYVHMAAACFTHLALRQGDPVGVAVENGTQFIRTRCARRTGQLARVMGALESIQPVGRASFVENLQRLARQLRGRGLLVLLSDFQDLDAKALETVLNTLRVRHWDLLAIQVLDPDEVNLPRDPAARFVDRESGREVIASPEIIAHQYERDFGQYLEALDRSFDASRTDHLRLRTDQNLGLALARFLHHREKRA